MTGLPRALTAMLAITALAAGFLDASITGAATIDVPADQPTIQAGIDAASPGDTVLVAPGTYLETIWIDREVAVRSAAGPSSTIIDGSQAAASDTACVVMFQLSGSTLSGATLEGFDIRNGHGIRYFAGSEDRVGGGIYLAEPTFTSPSGPGPLVLGNWIRNNDLDSGSGAGIFALGPIRVVGNRIFANRIEGQDLRGGAAAVEAYGSPFLGPALVQDNEIFDNQVLASPPSPTSPPEGAVVGAFANVIGNVIACNSGYRSSALELTHSGIIEFNTIASNFSPQTGPAVRLGHVRGSGHCDGVDITFRGNNVTHNIGPGLECIECIGTPLYILECNNIAINAPGGQVIGHCSGAIGQDGNISIDPVYGRVGCEAGSGNWCLDALSPLLLAPPPGCGLIGALGACTPISVPDTREGVADAAGRLRLRAPRPNPFSERTTIAFELLDAQEVEITVHDVRGRRLRRLTPGWLRSGEHAVEWDGRTDDGVRVASGVYVARITAGTEEVTRSLLLIR